MNKLTTILSCAFAASTLGAEALADERMRVGVFAGAHIFNDNLELGTFDAPDVDTPRNGVAFGIRAGYALVPRLSVEGELAIVPTKTRMAKSDVTVLGWRTSAVFDVPDFQRLRPFAVGGVGALTSSPADSAILDEDTDLAAHLGVGLEYSVSEDWGLRVDARTVFAPSSAGEGLTTDLEFFVGLYRGFPPDAPTPPPDSDKDGVFDSDDECPEGAEDQDGFRDEDGCPDPDNDGDGIPDVDDSCPVEKESHNGVDDTDGCPEPDGDGDGIIGTNDKCPNEKEDRDGTQDDDGCIDDDNDGDSIPDTADQCPDQKADTPDGCPPDETDTVQSETSQSPRGPDAPAAPKGATGPDASSKAPDPSP